MHCAEINLNISSCLFRICHLIFLYVLCQSVYAGQGDSIDPVSTGNLAVSILSCLLTLIIILITSIILCLAYKVPKIRRDQQNMAENQRNMQEAIENQRNMQQAVQRNMEDNLQNMQQAIQRNMDNNLQNMQQAVQRIMEDNLQNM